MAAEEEEEEEKQTYKTARGSQSKKQKTRSKMIKNCPFYFLLISLIKNLKSLQCQTRMFWKISHYRFF